MKIKNLLLTVGVMLFASNVKGQIKFNEVKFWVGSGQDSAVLLVNFNDGTEDSCYAWGVKFNGSISGSNMLAIVKTSDVNFDFKIESGFLDSVGYSQHNGKNGVSGFYWGTWSLDTSQTWESNLGLITDVVNGEIFGLSYTNFSPAILPGKAISAFNPMAFNFSNVLWWIGSGPDSTVLIVDFQNGKSFAWGYKHGDTAIAKDMLSAISIADNQFNVDAGTFLNAIYYQSDSGVGGTPDYWSTWSADNMGNWSLNSGIGESLSGIKFFGCSYTDFAPALRPHYFPVPVVSPSVLVYPMNVQLVSVYPNPTTDNLFFELPYKQDVSYKITDFSGKEILTGISRGIVDVQSLANGVYYIQILFNNTNLVTKFIKD